MNGSEKISRDDWQTIIHAPLHVYRLVASVESEPIEAQFRRLTEELQAAIGTMASGSVGQLMAEALVGNLDALWIAFRDANRNPRDGLKRVKRALRKAPEDGSIAVRDWLVMLGVWIAEARHDMGGPAISDAEAGAVRDVAGWVGRPVPERPAAD